MSLDLWRCCVELLRDELSAQQFNTWIRPLQVELISGKIQIYAPNRFVLDWVSEKYLTRLLELIDKHSDQKPAPELSLCVGTKKSSVALVESPAFTHDQKLKLPKTEPAVEFSESTLTHKKSYKSKSQRQVKQKTQVLFEDKPEQLSIPVEIQESTSICSTKPIFSNAYDQNKIKSVVSSDIKAIAENKELSVQNNWNLKHVSYLNKAFTFETFVEGKSNQLARAAAWQVAENMGNSYNPLFLYGGVGLGKTHLMHAIGNSLLKKNPQMKIVYLHSERFVADMVKALQMNAIGDFKKFYRSVDALLIDDIQFFARKERSQEEFFHTFNSLLEIGQQVILTSDRYPKEIEGLEDRLKSRFGWGLTVAVEPPELETRVAILINKAMQTGVSLSQDAAFFIAQRVRSNVRELEGALKRVIAHAHFMGCGITIDLVRESLKDLLALQEKLVSIENIQRVVAEYYKLKLIDLLSKKRTRSIARPRQMAMALSKELTSHSLPEIGNAFGGRDHTTVLHACRQILKLREADLEIHEDYKNLLRILSS